MPVSVTMPRLGESVTEGTVTRWLKKEGEKVEADEPLLEVSTDKVDTEIPAPASGVLTSIKVAEDETVEVGVELAVIGDAGDDTGSAAPPAAEAAAPPAPAPTPAPAASAPPTPAPAPAAPAPQAPAAETAEPEDDGQPSYVTPLVRRLAAEHNVDLGQVAGTGVGGRIRKQDVLDAARAGGSGANGTAAAAPAAPAPTAPAARPAPAPAPVSAAPAPARAGTASVAAQQASLRGRTEKLSRLRTVIAQRMVESLQVSAQLTTVVEVDVTRIAQLRARAKDAFEAREATKLSFLPFFGVATVEAIKAFPQINSSLDLDAGTITYHDGVHLGIAVDTERGLLVPVLHNAQDLNLGGMARKIADLAARTRANQVSPDELGGGTFTLTNTGSRGALFDTPIINQPQVAILGTGAVVKRPAVVNTEELGEIIAVRSLCYFSLTYDHRVVDGADAARFLTTVKARIEEGDFEGELGL
jgi:pyruvate dehydrogenase E2 component (dihydrolipoamide acetyltransferase)